PAQTVECRARPAHRLGGRARSRRRCAGAAAPALSSRPRDLYRPRADDRRRIGRDAQGTQPPRRRRALAQAGLSLVGRRCDRARPRAGAGDRASPCGARGLAGGGRFPRLAPRLPRRIAPPRSHGRRVRFSASHDGAALKIRAAPVLRLGPTHLGRQRHEDRFDMAAGLEAEERAAVIDEIELDIAAAADELKTPLLLGPALAHVAAHQRRIDAEKRLADIAGEGEIARPIAAVEIVEENSAHAARLVAVLQKEIFVAPGFEARVIGGIVLVACGFERRMELLRIRRDRIDRRQVGAAAEPGFRRDEMPRVHVHRRHQRRARMNDERDAARPKARIAFGAGNLAAKFGTELAPDGRDIDAGLLEDLAFEERDRAAAAAFALPGRALEARRAGAGNVRLDRLERRADAVAQRLEPGARLPLMRRLFAHGVASGHCPVCLISSPNTMEAASATLSERAGARTGIATRASTTAWTDSGTPPDSRPNSRLSSGRKAKR